MSKLEKSVEDYLVEKVEAMGGVALKGAIQGRRFIDRILILPKGVTIWCEVKRPGKSSYGITAHQGETLDRLDKMEHITWKLNSRDEVDAFTQQVGMCARLDLDAYERRAALYAFCTVSSALAFPAAPRRSRAC